MKRQNIALGFYQNITTVKNTINQIKSNRLGRVATVHHLKDGSIKVDRYFPYLSKKIIDRFKFQVLQDEILIIVDVYEGKCAETLNTLRQVESGHPISFLLRAPIIVPAEFMITPNKEPLTSEQLQQKAINLAKELQVVTNKNIKHYNLTKRLAHLENILPYLQRDISESEELEQTTSLSAEWFLDNMYIIEGSIEEVKRNLPESYYKQLPKVVNGPLKGSPRTYAIASEILNDSAGRLTKEGIIEFIQSYQSVEPLNIGELWALPLMLRYRIIEWLQSLALEVDHRIREGELANYWGNRLLYLARRSPAMVPELLEEIKREIPVPDPHFAEELLDHLFDEEAVLPLVRKWLEGHFSLPINEVIHNEQLDETSDQLAFSNSIGSLITLNQLSWREIFEKVSIVDNILKDDPSNTYTKMNFHTRNRYRTVIELLSRRSKYTEVDIARETIHLAKSKQGVQEHVGYYLIDEGRNELEKEIKYKPTLPQSIRKVIKTHPAPFYICSIVLLTLLMDGLLFHHLRNLGFTPFKNFLFCLLSSFPLSELSIQIVNFFITKMLPPQGIPQMSYENGIPQEYKTFVVVPTLLINEETIRNDLNQLEIRYLANTEPQLKYGLFTDYTDSIVREQPKDAALLLAVVKGIEALDKKYGPDRFFLFHRRRSWSKSESAWIGWERKRGKLETLNKYLSGEKLSENILYYGEADKLKETRFVITLDADTQLPKNSGKELIEVISHPLNQPVLSPVGNQIVRGYSIIQPLVSTDFTNTKKSWFTGIFAEPYVVDPYTKAISNVFQDLANDGTYHGKGIYDVKAFNSVLSNRYPEAHLLSHDLLEGAFAKVGFAGSICLFDQFPEDYLTWTLRAHRWIRGDFQISDWLLSYCPICDGKYVKNTITAISRWKIFDNLRRAFMPMILMVLLIAGWLTSPLTFIFTGLVLIALFLPFIVLFVNKLLNCNLKFFTWNFTDLGLSFVRCLIYTALLPNDAYFSLDAIVRVIYRRAFSHKKLLQWMTSGYKGKSYNKFHQNFLYLLCFIGLLGVAVLIFVMQYHPGATMAAVPICLLWALSPFIVYCLDRPLLKNPIQNISEEDRQFLHFVARKTWRYYDEFVNPQTNWLPPDNYQTGLKVELAMRTSPTNVGMWLIGTLAGYDLHYLSIDQLISRVTNTVHAMKKLERYEGHFLNWFNIENLYPLFPRYISTVDSGNLLASMWTLEQGLYDACEKPLLPLNVILGLRDTFKAGKEEKSLQNEQLEKIIFSPVPTLRDLVKIIREALALLREGHENTYWSTQLEKELTDWETIIIRYFAWVDILESFSQDQLSSIDLKAGEWRKELLSSHPSLKSLALGTFSDKFKCFTDLARKEEISVEVALACKKLKDALETSRWLAGEILGNINETIYDLQTFSSEMNLGYLYNKDRKLFSIGYNVDEKRLDNSFYDLLASEARIASFVAIAKGDVPIEHWWALSRSYTIIQGKRILLSWAGTMFEYLMPLIFNRQYRDSLIGEACYNVVAAQINYGKLRGIPWGISEAAYSAIDSQKTYQYRSFGIPGVGLKRGLEEDLVVSPYSSALALPVNTSAAIANLKHLADEKEHRMLGPYGFYESIDFTRQSGPEGKRGVIIYAFMAHHQGMILSSINNLLNDYVIPDEFHKDPRVSGVTSLLYEKIPLSPAIKVGGQRKDIPLDRLLPISTKPIMGVVETPESETPKVNLLSNGQYSIMVTNAGGGYSQWKEFDISRWKSDTTCDSAGNFYYIKDLQSGEFWSHAYHPTNKISDHYSVSFKSDKADFKRRDFDIETHTEIVVSPEDNAEVWVITLINHSPKKRFLEVTSYIELVLAPHATDRAHPIFNKMFIETEAIENGKGLLAFRRQRAEKDAPIWVGHVANVNQAEGYTEFETDRAKFIGRGHTLQNPRGVETSLTQTTGAVLDPILSIRKRVTIESGSRVEITFTTFATENRDAAINLIDKYKNPAAGGRAKELAWTYSQLELRHLRVQQEEAQLFQKLASRILYPHIQLRATQDRFKNNRLNQTKLWSHGISGDLPIVVVTIGDLYDIEVVKQLLVAHSFWNMRGLKCDLVILNEEAEGYEQPLFEQLQRLIQSFAHRSQVETPGGVFLRSTNTIPPEEVNQILCVARAILVAARGPLRQQLVSPYPITRYPEKFTPTKKGADFPTPPLSFFELEGFNTLGGFTHDGKQYVTILDEDKHTPAPWINVLANPQFGCLVSETGLGFTWYGNSQANRLTPWSNDPLLNPITDAIFIRDEELGSIWTATPSPIREKDPYRIIHSQGYSKFEHNSHGIHLELEIFVPVDDKEGLPVRIQRLKILNTTQTKRRLSITGYSEIILGTNKEETQTHILTEWDPETQSLYAYNPYQIDYGSYQMFTTSVPAANTYTGDRTEFIGRNNTLRQPAALQRKKLSGHVGAALDPCSALQIMIELEPNEEKQISFILGFSENKNQTQELLQACNTEQKIDQLFQNTVNWWDRTLSKVQVEIPGYLEKHFLNRWLLYQTLSCRLWGRSAFYQSSGAYGFRDQLQDSMALLYSVPSQARQQILRSAARQFLEGDVQHWWHPQNGGGVRTRISDDLLWLPFVTAQYVRVTGDVSILDEQIPFLEAPLLTEEQHEVYSSPAISKEKASLLEHCKRAVVKGVTSGPHGLPLMGTGDWNDGMNLVGEKGIGESVWLAWFIIHVLDDFAELVEIKNGKGSGDGYRKQAQHLAEVIEESAWDGEWYLRAFFDDGTPLGSKESPEAKIDCIAQSWSVISGYGKKERVDKALYSADEHLVKDDIVRLLTPPFDKSALQPGYIKGYPPGVRENGGQYTHGSSWLALAYARQGNGNRAVELLNMLGPSVHSYNPERLGVYKVEPYVIVADIYDLPGQVGRGGWTWYTGSSAWIYRIWLEEVLGFTMNGDVLQIHPNIPKEWKQFKIFYHHFDAEYIIHVMNPKGLSSGKNKIVIDGIERQEPITLSKAGKHSILVTIEN